MRRAVKLLKLNWFIFAGMLGGGIGGFLYWRFVGCASGSCAITGSPVLSTVWGALIVGLILYALFSKSDKPKKPKEKRGKAGEKSDTPEEKRDTPGEKRD